MLLANEVLDAMPVQRFRVGADGGFEQAGVGWDGQGLVEQFQPLFAADVDTALQDDWVAFGNALPWRLPAGYISEFNPAAKPLWIDLSRSIDL